MIRLRDYTLKKSFLLFFVFMVVIVTIFSILSIGYLYEISANETNQKETHQIIITRSLSLKEHLAVMRQHEKDILLNIRKKDMIGGYIVKWEEVHAATLRDLNEIHDKVGYRKEKEQLKRMVGDLTLYRDNIRALIKKIGINQFQSPEDVIEAMNSYRKPEYDYAELIDSILDMSHLNMNYSFESTISMIGRIIRSMIIVAALSLIAIVLAIRFVLRRIIDPIGRLKADIDSLSPEDFTGFVDLDFRGNNEITELALSFNRLMKLRIKAEMELLDYKNHLEQKVEERAREIIEINRRLTEEIAAHRTAANACSISEEKFRIIASSAPDAIIMVNEKDEIVFFNESAQRIFGYDREEVMNRHYRILIPSSFYESFRGEFSGFFPSGSEPLKKKTMEFSAARKDGTEFPVEVSISPILIGGEWNAIGIARDITQRKKYEKDIARLATVIEQVNESVVITDLRGNIEYVNPYFEKATGYSAEEALGNNPRILKSGIQGDGVYRDMWGTIRDGKDWTGHFINRRKDGSLYDEEAHIFPVRDSGGNIINYATVKRDITEKLRAEARIREQNEFLNTVINSLTHPFYVIDAKTYEIIMSNESGSWTSDMKGAKCFEVNHGLQLPCDETDFPCPLVEIRKTGKPTSLEHMYRSDAGEEKYKEIYGYPIFDNSGNVIQIIEYVIDITDRKLAEKELLKFSRAVEQSLSIIVITDTDTVIEYANPKFSEITGYSRHEVVGQKASFLGLQNEDERKKFWEKLAAEGEWQGEFHNRKKNGERYWEYAAVTPIRDSGGVIRNYLKVGTDITKKKDIERELREARIEAEKASYFKSQFLANMSHEIRTPMNSILGFMDLLNKTELNAKQREYMSIVTKSAGGLLEIIDEILDFSRIERGVIKVDTVQFSPIREFELICELIAPMAEKKKIDLLFFIDPNLPEVIEGSLSRLKQVIINLMGNAVKFSPENGIILTDIVMTGAEGDFCTINFSVSDKGIGIPDGKQRDVFESFVQADSSITRKFGGTGLGLAISEKYVKLLGGEISLISKEGVGSWFFFELKFRIVRPKGAGPAEPAGLPLTIFDPSGTHELHALLLERYLDILALPHGRSDAISEIPSGAGNVMFLFPDPDLIADCMREPDGMNPDRIIIVGPGDELSYIAAAGPRGRRFRYLNTPVTCTRLMKTLGLMPGGSDDEDQTGWVRDYRKPPLYGARVLVAEDNEINQKLITIMLQDMGIAVDIAENGAEAVDKYRSGRYDLVLMDIHMPVMNGIDAAGEIMRLKDHPGGSPAPVIALTADVINTDMKMLNEKGITDFVAKPISGINLSRLMKKYIGHAETKEEGSPMNREDIIGDLDRTAKILSIGRDVLLGLIRKFLSKSAEFTGNMEAHMRAADMDRLSKEAHKLKGAASNLRLPGLVEIAQIIEMCARNGTPCDYPGKIEDLKRELEKLAGLYGGLTIE